MWKIVSNFWEGLVNKQMNKIPSLDKNKFLLEEICLNLSSCWPKTSKRDIQLEFSEYSEIFTDAAVVNSGVEVIFISLVRHITTIKFQ